MSGRVRSVSKFHCTGPNRLCRRPATKHASDINPFLPRDAMLMRYMLSSCVRPSVCLPVCSSLTSRYCVKSDKLRITQTTPHDSPETPVFDAKGLHEIRPESTHTGGAKCMWGGQNRRLWTNNWLFIENGTR